MIASHRDVLKQLTTRLNQLVPNKLDGGYYQCGLEKEALRIAAGRIADTCHPAALGSPLTHAYLTTDFSEALLEFITPPLAQIDEVLVFLTDLHQFVYCHLGKEMLWSSSMPCYLRSGADIPLARYGSSNAGLMKTVYRRGLANRYGRMMQAIAGVHFNFSINESVWPLLQESWQDMSNPSDFRNERYMGMIRTLQRLGWLVPYLFGASPAVDRSFIQQARTQLQPFDAETYYLPYATSLRMGDIGYQNRQEEGTGIKACYDSLDAYIRSLTWAIETPCPQYESIGVKVGDRYEQLNDHVLQIENEYYSTVRPKQLTDWMERPTLALRRRGIRYIELRSVDVNVFHPLGVDAEQLYFLATLLCYSLLVDSPRITAQERRAIDTNELYTAHQGRAPGLTLDYHGQAVLLTEWAQVVLDEMLPVAAWLDNGSAGRHTQSVMAQFVKVHDPNCTPSAQLLTTMQEHHLGFIPIVQQFNEQHRRLFQSQCLTADREQWFKRLADASWQQQRQIETNDGVEFDQFLAQYFAQDDDFFCPACQGDMKNVSVKSRVFL
ncbi:glutamate--cysteine ligase [Thiospirillum jenense]|uniref:Glutamate--cysteine ligase n=1 Tax=Thiospirillum jenense TaxID=1653858 RepID=A0A839HJU6_9GAMM|nr:glutamate--cysteine ligase [Thiospirillum jenense]MBB1127186.1 glutamate--cysteine ligase [Thiospirillum jenense]